MNVRSKFIVAAAEGQLQRFKIQKPPVDVEAIAKGLGLVVNLGYQADDTSGFLLRRPGQPPMIGVNAFHSVTRQRFTIAHEIGHFLMHEGRGLYLDQAFSMNFRNGSSSKGTHAEEIEANLFAANLLMPEEFVAQAVQSLGARFCVCDDEQINKLADGFKVSKAAMSIRLQNLDYC
jgi:Zn-dependent peptidase ImmA (M78 family)